MPLREQKTLECTGAVTGQRNTRCANGKKKRERVFMGRKKRDPKWGGEESVSGAKKKGGASERVMD